MNKALTIWVSVFLLSACGSNQILVGSDKQSYKKQISKSIISAQVSENLESGCQYEYVNMTKLTRFASDTANTFSSVAKTLQNSNVIIEVTEEISRNPTPFPMDERNVSEAYLRGWVNNLKVEVSGDDVYIPITAFATMELSESVEVGDFSNDESFIIKFVGSSLQGNTAMRVSKILCDPNNNSRSVYQLEFSEWWYPPMGEDSCIKTYYKIPICN